MVKFQHLIAAKNQRRRVPFGQFAGLHLGQGIGDVARMGALGLQRAADRFLINAGGATAADLEGLGEEVRKKVYHTSGIELEWEIMRVGEPAPDESGATEPDKGQ